MHASCPAFKRSCTCVQCIVTTRTTALTSIPLSSFALRFSDLEDIEVAIHEDEEQRAERTMDWIGSRVQIRCASWVELFEKQSSLVPSEGPWKDRTPWWEEVKRCVESDHVPNRFEGWNHPVASSYLSFNELDTMLLSSVYISNSNICSFYYCRKSITSIARAAVTTNRLSTMGRCNVLALLTDSAPVHVFTF